MAKKLCQEWKVVKPSEPQRRADGAAGWSLGGRADVKTADAAARFF